MSTADDMMRDKHGLGPRPAECTHPTRIMLLAGTTECIDCGERRDAITGSVLPRSSGPA